MTPKVMESSMEQELPEFIAVGCLCLFPPSQLGRQPSIVWERLNDVEHLRETLPSDLGFVVELYLAKWIQLQKATGSDSIVFRVYILPDDVAASTVDRRSAKLRSSLARLCSRLDLSAAAWAGHADPHSSVSFDLWASGIDKSLFWLFNNLPSPSPCASQVQDRYSRFAIEELLLPDPSIPDLKACLYPYQARTVASMIQKETVSTPTLDPRFEIRTSAPGVKYYYNARDIQFRLTAPEYENSRGGILAETMGVGKTIMCIALVLATRFHLPHVPPQYSTRVYRQDRVRSLKDMAIANAVKSSAPLNSHLHWFYKDIDEDMGHLTKAINSAPHMYEIPHFARRSARATSNNQLPPPRHLRLCSTTIIVVPRNLLYQWQAEFAKHVDFKSKTPLQILSLEKSADQMPNAEKIAQYDVLLLSKTRFENEIKDGQDEHGRSKNNVRAVCRCPYIGSTRIRDCSCLRPEDIYSSPLKELHFLRIIIDEGHEFSSASSNAVKVATRLVTAERRWVVSGTPAKERLFGVDVELAGHPEDQLSRSSSIECRYEQVLDRRQSFNRKAELNGASKSLGTLLGNFLQVQPWAKNADGGQEKVDFEDYAFRHEAFRVKTHSAFSQCLNLTLQSLVLKTRPEDVEKDIILPPINVSVKYLDPCFYDLVTLNLFIFFITANAVTSERTDVDYLFHKNSTAARHALIRNLRHSAFFWTGWTEQNVRDAIGHSTRYLEKDNISCSLGDRKRLLACLEFANYLINSSCSWKAMYKTHEMVAFVEDWPDGVGSEWSLNPGNFKPPMAIGATQLRSAQQFINSRLFDEDCLDGFSTLGQNEVGKASLPQEANSGVEERASHGIKMGVPTSGLMEKHADSRQQASPKKGSMKALHVANAPHPMHLGRTEEPPKRKRLGSFDDREVSPDCPLARTRVIGTVSSKLSYLLQRVLALYTAEKILIFYDHDNAAWYISQMLDLFHIKHLIYSRTLKPDQKSRYIVSFDTDDSIRVLLMDIGQGAWGLNVNKASRVFFLNPPCSPHTEAQAIKRAHRIGQTKPVFVETLVLRGTIEESIFKRSKQMTQEEHDNAGKEGREISNDSQIAAVIQDAQSVPIAAGLDVGDNQMAPLDVPLQIFGRKGRNDVKVKDIDQDGTTKAAKRPKNRRKEEVIAAKQVYNAPLVEEAHASATASSGILNNPA